MTETEHLLSVLAEECCEVGQRVSKALRFGLNEIQEGQPHTNAERIMRELLDLTAAVQMLEESWVLKPAENRRIAIEEKKAKVRRYMEYAEQCGALKGAV